MKLLRAALAAAHARGALPLVGAAWGVTERKANLSLRERRTTSNATVAAKPVYRPNLARIKICGWTWGWFLPKKN